MAANNKNTSRKASLFGRLKTAVKKVIILMKFNKNPWRLAASILGRSGRGLGRGGGRALSSRRWSFNEGLGLIAIMSSPTDSDRSNSLTPYMTPSPEFSPEQENSKSFSLQKSKSFPEEDDINKRADMFIENFYRRLMMERQVSLKLRYPRNSSYGSGSSGSN